MLVIIINGKGRVAERGLVDQLMRARKRERDVLVKWHGEERGPDRGEG